MDAVGLLWALARRGPTLYALVAWRAAAGEGRPALVVEGRPVSFAALLALADAASPALAGRGPVGLALRDPLALVAALLACGRLGRPAVLLDPRQDPARLGRAARSVGARVLVTDGEGPAGGLPVLPAAALAGPGTHRPAWPRAALPVVLTSGTTGEPRPVRRRRPRPLVLTRALWGLWRGLGVRPGAPTLLALPLWHGHGLATLGAGLALGAPLHLRRDPADLRGDLATGGIEVLVLVPTVLRRVLREGAPAPGLRAVLCGSGPLDPDLCDLARARWGDVLHNLYGTTETGLIAHARPADLRAAPGTVGRPLPGVRLRLGSTGEVEVRGPLAPARGWWPTGDLGRVDGAGRLRLLGRRDDVLVIGGENVHPDGVEALLREVPGVRDAAVLGVPCAEYGQALHALLVLEDGVADADLRAAFAARLPRRLCPVALTRVAALPRTESGKLRRRDLSGLLLASGA